MINEVSVFIYRSELTIAEIEYKQRSVLFVIVSAGLSKSWISYLMNDITSLHVGVGVVVIVCNQYISLLTFWFRITHMQGVFDATLGEKFVIDLPHVCGFLQALWFPPLVKPTRYNWHIATSGVKHHDP